MHHKLSIAALLLSFAVPAHAAIPDAQRQALVDFFNATHGASWTKNTGWNGAAGTECTWFGVTCDGDSTTVTGLTLPSNAMVGAIPHSFLTLSDLNSLSIEFNGLYSTDPQVVAFINAHQPNILNFQTVAPTGLVALPDNRSTLTLSWTQVPYRTQDTHFDIYSGSTLLKSVPYTSNVATFTGLDSTKSYSFQIRTVTGGLTSDPSPTVTGTPGVPRRQFEIASSTLKTFWVDPVRGSDSNDGATEATALKTPNAAYQAASLYSGQRGGYEIVLRPGDYPQSAFDSQLIAQGSQEAPAVMRAEVPGTAILHGILGAQGSHIYLIGLTTADTPPGGSAIAIGNVDYLLLRDIHTTAPVNVVSGSHIYIENLTVSSTSGGIEISNAQYGHILDNRVSSDLNACMQLDTGAAYFLIDSNDIGPCNIGGGIRVGGPSSLNRHTSPWIHYAAYDVKVTNNVIHDPGLFTFEVEGGYDVLIAQNTVVTSKNTFFLFATLAQRSCEKASACQTLHDAGGWGPTAPGGNAQIPNRNVTVAANIFDAPSATPQEVIVSVQAPDTTSNANSNAPSPAAADDDLVIAGNVFWAPTAQLLGTTGGGCTNANPTCNAGQLASNNFFNFLNPQLQANERPLANGNLFGLAPVTIAPFTWTDAPTKPPVPQGELVNTVTSDDDDLLRTAYVPGAFTSAVAPARGRVVKH